MKSQLSITDYVAIVGLILAIYGAILSTINSAIQFIAHRRDRADVILKVRQNMSNVHKRRYANMKLTLVTATNKGKRPVTIQAFSTKLLDSRTEYLLGDIRPPIPHEITEGQSISAFVDEAGGDLRYVEYYYVWDSVGRNFKANMVPWPRRLVSRLRRKFAPVERMRKKSVGG